MADRGSPSDGRGLGPEQWQGGGPPPSRPTRPYDYGKSVAGKGAYSGDYGYSEPFDYRSADVPSAPRVGPPPGRVVPVDSSDSEGATQQTMRLTPVPAEHPLAPETADGEQIGPAPGRGRAERRRAAKRIKRRRRLSATKEIPILIGVALLIALVLKTFLVQAFVIPSGSMEQTIKIGDRVLVDKLTPWFGSKPERGDVIVFKDPGGWLHTEKGEQEEDPLGVKTVLSAIGLMPSADEQDLIKRAVGLGGDTVECCDKQGRVTVNGTPLDEPYLHPGNTPSQMKFKVTVPIGRVFVMGDHRANSADSRFHLDDKHRGTVPEDQVLGRAMVIAWPFDHWQRLEEPATFAAVPDSGGGDTTAAGDGENRVKGVPIPAELPLVIGVVGLFRHPGRRWKSVRSKRGGRGGRRPVRFGRRERSAS